MSESSAAADVKARTTALRDEPAPKGEGRGPAEPRSTGEPVPAAAEPDAQSGRRKSPVMRIVLLVALVVALVIGVPWGINYWRYNTTHVSTDDAYVAGNLVSVSPVISGTLVDLTVDEGAYVHRGQLIARLSDAGPSAALRQARANYQAALSQVPEAERNLLYQQETTNAAIRRAQAALGAQQAKARGARQLVGLTSGTTRNQVQQAQSQVGAAVALQQQAVAQARTADVTVETYRQAVQTALTGLESARQQVVTAGGAVRAALARVQAAQSDADRAAKDEARYRVLYTQDAVSAQVYDNARAQAQSALSALQAAQAQSEEAQSQVEQANAGVRQAQSQVEQARKNVAQYQSQARAAHRGADAAAQQVNVARTGVSLARTNTSQVAIQQSALESTAGQTGESQADIEAARAGMQQVAARRSQIDIFRAQARQALAALNNAEVTLADTKIYAPADGKIVKKISNPGASLAPGQTIVTMTQGNDVWVEANFKETQLRDMRPGEDAEIEVDAQPGKVFKARVHSINEVTGAATSLLPPDNATGNFTKVVQRVPVRLEIIPANDNEDKKYARQSDIGNLRQGMSVTAIVAINSRPRESTKSGSAAGTVRIAADTERARVRTGRADGLSALRFDGGAR